MEDFIKKFELNKKTWTGKSFHGVLHYFFIVGEQPLKTLRDYYGDSYSFTVFYIKDNVIHWHWNDEEMIRLRESFIEKVNEDPSIIDSFLETWHGRLRDFDTVMKEVDETGLEKLDDKTLLDLYKKWYQSYLAEYGISIGIQDAFSMHSERFLEPQIKDALRSADIKEENVDELYLLLISPVVESFVTHEYRDRLHILKDFKAGKDITEALKEHTQKYHWIQNNYAKDQRLSASYFQEQLDAIKDRDPLEELANLDSDLKNVKEKKKELIEKLKLDQSIRNLIQISEVFAYVQDERKKYVLIATHYQHIFIKELGKRLGLSEKHMEYTFIHELEDLLKADELDITELEKRKSGVLVLQTLNGYEIVSGELAEEMHNSIFIKSESEQLTELKGSVASKGQAKGEVKIIRTTHDMVNMNEGDVLVASMTRPEMVPAMKKAIAIVTDEGGVTSHAAIVSRELNIPCVIGTKIATKVLKDGTEVEVDADKGIVKIIKDRLNE